VVATPVARRVAEEEGVDLAAVQGGGPGGQMTKEDVLAYVAAARAGQSPAGAPVAAPAPGGVNETGQASLAPSTLPIPDLADTASAVVQRLAVEHSVDLRGLAAGPSAR
jgi:pyruvate/2-oxoglutarate dehydrogenase complex dihydrolipoamide acyltransferase (E2) component